MLSRLSYSSYSSYSSMKSEPFEKVKVRYILRRNDPEWRNGTLFPPDQSEE